MDRNNLERFIAHKVDLDRMPKWQLLKILGPSLYEQYQDLPQGELTTVIVTEVNQKTKTVTLKAVDEKT